MRLKREEASGGKETNEVYKSCKRTEADDEFSMVGPMLCCVRCTVQPRLKETLLLGSVFILKGAIPGFLLPLRINGVRFCQEADATQLQFIRSTEAGATIYFPSPN
mmetsp:Transcript_11018/g.26630  ORF Transcript_11018/g.26630 Transcript_11018/m.26630 type:complete len:106 (-) Transcript_11018:1781-2098(-)